MELLRNRPIGIFDSGVGGLTVVKNVCKYLPKEDIIYFGDTARVPYGNKSRATVIRFTHEIMTFMMKQKVKMVVVACNTASSFSLSILKKTYPVPVVGVIDAGVERAIRFSSKGKIGVIGTSSTIFSQAYEKRLAKIAPEYGLISKSCPLFVPLVENKLINDDITYRIAKKYLIPLTKKGIDTLILGCTHYPILKNVIKKIMKDVKLIDSSSAVAKKVKKMLKHMDMETSRRNRKSRIKYYVSDDAKGFCGIAGGFLREKIKAKKVII